MERTWVSPTGDVHVVADAALYQFCSSRGLHYDNMVVHIQNPKSDQKNGGWRLLERLRAIGHVDRPTEHILALGTLEDFHQECLSSTDGRAVLKSRTNLPKLLGGYYNGGKPWNKWETRVLSTAEKLQLLQPNRSQQQPLPAAGSVALPQVVLPDYGLALEVHMDDADTGAVQTERANNDCSRLPGSSEVSLECQNIFIARAMHQCRSPLPIPTRSAFVSG